MNRNKFNNKKLIILFVILFISIGFALLSTNLNIRGLVGFNSKWDVHFDNIQVITNDTESDSPILADDRTSLTFSGNFSEPSEVFEFSVDVVNDGTINAMLNEILKTGITSENSNFIEYNINYYNDLEIEKLDLLKAESRTRINVKVEYKYDVDILATLEEQNFSLALNYVSATKEAVDRKNDFQLSDNSNVITLSNAKKNSMSNLRIYGNSEQTTYSGQNLYNYKDYNNSSAKLSDDGWITLSYNNVEGTAPAYIFHSTNNLNLNSEKKYVVILEVKSVSGSGVIHPTSYYDNYGQLKDHYYTFENLANNKIYYYVASVNDGYIGDAGLRTYISVQPGESGSITFRLSVIEGENIDINNFKYEPYVGEISSPSPEYPQEVKSLTGNSNLTITGKNLLNLNLDGLATMDGQTAIFLHNEGGWWTTHSKNLPKLVVGETYTISVTFVNNNSNYSSGIHFWFDTSDGKMSNNVLLSKQNSYKSTFVCESDDFFRLRIAFDSSKTEETDFAVRFQIEAGSEATEWEPYKGHSYDLGLDNIKLNGIDDYRDYIHYMNGKWYIHKEIEEYTFKGEEHFESLTSGKGDALNKKRFGILDFPMKLINARKQGCLSDFYKGIPYNNGIHTNNIMNSTALYDSGKTFAFTTNSETMTMDEFKSLIAGSKYYYVLNKPKEVEIKDQNLINQLNSIIDNNLYEGYNYLVFDSNIKTNIDFDYKN